MNDCAALGRGFDRLVDQEWSTFCVGLADRIASLGEGDDVTFRQHGGELPRIVVTRVDADAFEVAAPAVQATDASDPQVRRLRAWGFDMGLVVVGPGRVSWGRSLIPSPDEAAWWSVRLCREVYGVLSPALLDAGSMATDAPSEVACEEPAQGFDPRLPIAVDGQGELADAIEKTLSVVAPGAFERDGTTFRFGDAGNAVSILPDGSRRAVWVVMYPVAVRPTAVAGREIQILNRGARYGRYYLDRGMLVAEAMVVADPFVPNQLADVIVGLIEEAQGLAKDFAWRTHGKVQCTEWSG